jgi:hypothetical protein
MIEEIKNKIAGKEVWIVADGPSCPIIEPPENVCVIAVNNGYKNVSKKPYICLYVDSNFRLSQNNLSSIADYILYSQHSGNPGINNGIEYKRLYRRSLNTNDGLYCGLPPDGTSAGVGALSLALEMKPKIIRLFGFDYRVYSEGESLEIFGEKKGIHKSISDHRFTEVNEQSKRIFTTKIKSFDPFIGIEKIINHCTSSNLYQFQRLKFNLNEVIL